MLGPTSNFGASAPRHHPAHGHACETSRAVFDMTDHETLAFSSQIADLPEARTDSMLAQFATSGHMRRAEIQADAIVDDFPGLSVFSSAFGQTASIRQSSSDEVAVNSRISRAERER